MKIYRRMLRQTRGPYACLEIPLGRILPQQANKFLNCFKTTQSIANSRDGGQLQTSTWSVRRGSPTCLD